MVSSLGRSNSLGSNDNDSGSQVNRALHRWAPLLAVGVLLVAAWLAAAFSSPQINNLPVPPLRAAGSVSPSDESSSPQPSATEVESSETSTTVEAPDERGGLIAVAVVVMIIVAGGIAGWVVFRRRLAADRADPLVYSRKVAARSAKRSDTVVAAVDAGLTQLSDTEMDPRRAVIACWVRLEQAAAAVGTPRHIGDSPTDLVTRLLQAHRVGQGSLDALAGVYREARYAAHTIDERMRAAAVEALRQVRAELGAAVPRIAGQRQLQPATTGAGQGAGVGRGAGPGGGAG